MMFIISTATINKKTSGTNLLKFNAPWISPCRNLDIPLVIPQAGQLQSAKKPSVGQLPLKIKGNKKCLKTHFTGEYTKDWVGKEERKRKIEEILKTIACGEPKLSISSSLFTGIPIRYP
jgi:hypothetical protein